MIVDRLRRTKKINTVFSVHCLVLRSRINAVLAVNGNRNEVRGIKEMGNYKIILPPHTHCGRGSVSASVSYSCLPGQSD